MYCLVRLVGRFVCSKKVIEGECTFSYVTVEGSVVDSNMDEFSRFSGNLFAVLVCYLEVGDVNSRVVVGNAVYIHCTSDMAIVSFYSIFTSHAGFSVGKDVVIFWAGPPVRLCFVLAVMEG